MDVEGNALAEYLSVLEPLIGDRRTRRTVRGTIEGIIAAESLGCTQIAAFSPSVGGEEERV
jgi:hypothetical protein